MTTLTHPTLIDPATGEPLEALGVRANGSPIWPMIGGSDGIGVGTLPNDDSDDEDEGGDDTPDDSDDADEKPKPKSKAPAKKAGDEDEDEDSDDEPDPDSPAKLRDLRRLRKENQKLRAASKLAEDERKELEALREEKLTEKEKLERRAHRGETSSSELKAQLEETRLRLALGLPELDDDSEVDEDPFDDVPIKGSTYEEKLANAKRFAKRYRLGRFAEKSESQEDKPSRSRKTPPPKDLKGQRGLEEDPEDNPIKLAARLDSSHFGL